MTGLIQRTWFNHDGVLMAIIKTAEGQTVSASVPAGSSEGQRLRLVDGVWRQQARAA